MKSYPDSEKINNISFEAETLFTRLIVKCDDNSNFFGSKNQVLGKIFAKRWEKKQLTLRKVGKLLDELVEQKLIIMYESGGESYLHIPNNIKCLRGDVKKITEYPEHKTRNENVTDTGRTRNENVTLEHTKNKNIPRTKKKPPTPLIPEKLNTLEFRNIWDEWKQHRKETKHELKPTTEKRQLKKLAENSESVAIAIIAQSLENGWQGLFEVKNNGKQQQATNPRDFDNQKSNIGERVEV